MLHSLVVGGAEVLAARLARALAPQYRFVFACLDELGTLGEELRGEGFSVEVLHRRPGVDFGSMRALRRLWRREGVSLVHAHQYTPFFYALAARQWRRFPPVLFTEHGRWFPDFRRPKRMLFNRLMLRRADRVVGVGEAVRRALVANEGIPAGRVQVIYNGVDGAAFNGQMDERPTVRRELGLDEDQFAVIQVARLDHLKDHGTALRAIERVVGRCRRVRLLLVGEGPERDAIETEIGRRRLEPYVRLLGLRSDVARLLKAADVFLLTSISEGIPVTVIEAMAAGLPVVSTDVGGVGEVVQHGATGLLAPSGNDAALADAILELAGAPALRQALGKRARSRAHDTFSQQRMHDAYRQCYDEMLGC